MTTTFFEFIMPEEERGTKVSLADLELDIEKEQMNTLEYVSFDDKVMKITARFSSHEINLRKLQVEEIDQIKESLIKHNFDDRFEIKLK
ncbi:hypothetical protein KO525_19450 [Psychrosphaera sp. B3R10]|uniref:hypothetical protein n=1 Tax=unclassified Psychrosphaera TaxID=2641570 RepID=UPI001C095882|nr:MULTISPECIES: hypothetical protein [unclassified Psychrosphaera]MBU2883817.1 hypothetical protein [Psychrosphaera sp. I2R16]MBU2991566.1 hypothetical protein [Psychrosphaera sp. B3R10]